MKLVGYCPSCSIAIAEHELGYRCMKCNRILLVEKQSGKEVAYNRRSVATPGVWNGSSKKGLDNAGTTM
jgi:hypothetical protein